MKKIKTDVRGREIPLPNQKIHIDTLIELLDEFIVSFGKSPKTDRERENECVWYWTGLNELGITQRMHDYYTREHPNDKIIQRFKEIVKIQERKLVLGALLKDSNIDRSTALKILHCKHGWIEEKDYRKLKLDERRIDIEEKRIGVNDVDDLLDTTEIGFADESES